jgi:N-acetyl-alpha-D-muramate 1-phosphate uridylyltransferase
MKAMILAAGKGTRMLPLTENKPKALIELKGVPLLEHTVKYLKNFGIDEMIINVHHFADQITDFLKRKNFFDIHIEISDEQQELLDTGGGLLKAHWFFDDKPFVLMASDVITSLNLSEMLKFHELHKPLATLAVKHRASTRELLFDSEYRLSGWMNNSTGEKKQVRDVVNKDKIAFSAIHIINPVLFNLINECGSFSITDVYLRLAAEHLILGYKHDESIWYECGRIENLDGLNHNPEIENIFRQFHN